MSREKSIFEKMGGTYTEKDGILYPNIRIGHYDLVRTGQLKQKAAEVNEEANELLDRIMHQYLQKNKPENPDSTMEMW